VPDHQEEAEYFASIRQAPKGISPSKARLAAQQQAKGLPTLATLPPAIRPAGPTTGPQRNTLNSPTGSWQALGPVGTDLDQLNPNNDYRFGLTSGRATAVVVGPHTGVIYLGTADGGVWKSTNNGASWTVLTDTQPSLAVGAMALDPADTTDNTLYVGTGETSYNIPPPPIFNGDAYFGVGVLKTTDGGATWTQQGQNVFGGGVYSANSVGFDTLLVVGSTIWAGTTQGMFQSTNGGTTWSRITVSGGHDTARVTDIAVDGANVYAVLSEAIPDASITYAGVYKSTTRGASGSFSLITTGLPATSTWGRTRMALAQSAPQILYLAISDGSDLLQESGVYKIYKTTDGGTGWAAVTGTVPDYVGGQASYDTVILADPTDATGNHVYAGGVYMVASTDGGATWATTADVYCNSATPGSPCRGPIHPDQHGILMVAGVLYVANDGGIYKTTNPNAGTGTTWTNLNANLNTTQFYAGDVAADYTANPIVAGGSQDNGTSRTTSTSAATWNGILGGDGGYVAIDKSDPKITYAEYAGGVLFKTTDASAGMNIDWGTNPLPLPVSHNEPCNGTLFVAPFVLDPNHNNHLVFGGGGAVCESIDSGASWYFSTTNFLTYFIQSLAIAPSNGAIIYAGTNRGHIWRTTAGNSGNRSAWTDMSTGFPTAPVTAIAVDPANADTVYVTFGNFGVRHVWETTNGGTSWTDIAGNLPDIPTTAIVTYPSFPSPVLIVGTDIGVYASVNGGTNWQILASNLPNVGIHQLFIDQARTTLFAATHGRGMWKIGIPVAGSLGITGLPATVGTGTPVTFTVTSKEPGGTTDPGYIGTVHFTSTDSAAMLPADYTFAGNGTGKDNGTHVFSVTFRTLGAQSVTVTDVHAGMLTTRASTTVAPVILAITPSSGTIAGGNPVTITGAGFGTDLSHVTVKFGATTATIRSVSDAQLVVTAPAGSGTVTVAVTVNGISAMPSGSYTYGGVNTLPGTKPGGGNGSANPLPDPRTSGPASGGTPDPIAQSRP
jgi:hypothetical protein